jgi:peptidoglycan/LPS O-acetylase OafA/YrhL
MGSQDRLRTLDGFRALAILLVIGFHYFTRWAPPESPVSLYPYGALGATCGVFRYGYLGVNLFFIISGFVISMTLFRSRSPGDFARKRFARLFPTMLLCSLATFLVVSLLPQQAIGLSWRNFLPSLTFTDPFLWSHLLGRDVHSMDGSYWSLYVEVKFYFWIGLLYFAAGPKRFFLSVAAAFAALVGAVQGMSLAHLPHVWALEFIFALDYMPWFVAGVGFYALHEDHRDWRGWLLVTEAALGAWAMLSRQPMADMIVALGALVLCYALFLLMLARARCLSWLSLRPVAAVGMASYSLYLLHQTLGVAILASLRGPLGPDAAWTAWIITPTLTLLMILASLLIYRCWEVPAKDFLLHSGVLGPRASNLRKQPQPENRPEL